MDKLKATAVGVVLLALLTGAVLVVRAIYRSDGSATEVPARAPAQIGDDARVQFLDLGDSLRTALERNGRRTAPAAVDYVAVLGAVRAATEEGRYADLEEPLSAVLADLEGLVAWVGRLGDSDAEPEIEEAEFEVLLMGLRLLLGIQATLEREGHRAMAIPLNEALDGLLTDILGRLDHLPREVALEILGDLESFDVLDVTSLELLARWLAPFEYCTPLARLVARLALREEPPRMDLLMELVHHGGPSLQLLVAELLADQPGSLGLELARDLARTLPPDSDLLRQADRLICQQAEPSEAFKHLLESASERGSDELSLAALDLGNRDLGTFVWDRYSGDLDPGMRNLLVLAGRRDAEFLEYVLEVDASDRVRGNALLNLPIARPDERTAARLVSGMDALAGRPWPRLPDASSAKRQTRAQNELDAAKNGYAMSLIHAVNTLRKNASPSVRSSSSYQRLRTHLTQLSQRSDVDDAGMELIRSVLLSF